jgi:hypothetical protein
MVARAVILVSLLVVGGAGLACDESTTSFQGPFSFPIVASVGDAPDSLIPEGGTVTILRVNNFASRSKPLIPATGRCRNRSERRATARTRTRSSRSTRRLTVVLCCFSSPPEREETRC